MVSNYLAWMYRQINFLEHLSKKIWNMLRRDGNKPLVISLQWRHNEHGGVSNTVVSFFHSTVSSGTDQRKHQSSSRAFVRGIYRWPMDSLCHRSLHEMRTLFVIRWWSTLPLNMLGGPVLKASGRVQFSPFQLADKSPMITDQHTAGGSVSQLSQLAKLSPWLTLSTKDIITSFWHYNKWFWFLFNQIMGLYLFLNPIELNLCIYGEQ